MKIPKNNYISISEETIQKKIFIIRAKKVMLDSHLAKLYSVETKQLNRQVKRNLKRFPEDFMFQLTLGEFQRCQIGTFKSSRKGRGKYLPYVFTEQGVAMLSSVLRSERAIQVNIAIMRVFVRVKSMLSTHKGLLEKINALENKTHRHDTEIQTIFEAIRQLIKVSDKPKRKIGFHSG